MAHDVFDLITRRDRTAIERMAAERDTTPAALAAALLEATLRGIRQAGVALDGSRLPAVVSAARRRSRPRT